MYWNKNLKNCSCKPSVELQKVIDRLGFIQSVYQDPEGGLAISTDKPCVDDDYAISLLGNFKYQGEWFTDDWRNGYNGGTAYDTDDKCTTFYLRPNDIFNLIKE